MTADRRIANYRRDALRKAYRYLSEMTVALDKVKDAPAYSQEEQDALAQFWLLRPQADRAFAPVSQYGEIVSVLAEME